MLPPLPMAEQAVGMSDPMLRPLVSSSHLLQSGEPGGSAVTTVGSAVGRIHRRPPHLCRIRRQGAGRPQPGSVRVPSFRLRHQLVKVGSDSQAAAGVLGLRDRLDYPHLPAASSEGIVSATHYSSPPGPEHRDRSGASPSSGNVDIRQARRPCRTITLSRPSARAAENPSARGLRRLRASAGQSSPRNAMVVRTLGPAAGKGDRGSSPGPIHLVRCLNSRLGGSGQRCGNWRPLDASREPSPHQLSGATRSFLRNAISHPRPAAIAERPTGHSPPPGQQHGGGLCQPHGRNPLRRIVRPRARLVAVGASARSATEGRARRRSLERCGRPMVQAATGLRGLAAGPRVIRRNPRTGRGGMGAPSGHRLVRITHFSAAPSVLRVAARPICHDRGRVHHSLDNPVGIRVPALCASRALPEEGGRRSSAIVGSGGTGMASPTVVCSSSTAPMPSTPAITAESRFTHEQPRRETPPAGQPGPPPPGRVANLCQRLQAEGLSPPAIQLVLASWRPSTEASYSSAWRAWVCWCATRNIDPFSPSVAAVLDYLADLYASGRQYRTINTHRSALSATLPPIADRPAGQHPLVCRLLRGIANLRPPIPRYALTWDVGQVLNHLRSFPLADSQTLPILLLSRKLTVLLALASGKRCSDLHALDVRFMRPTPTGHGTTIAVPVTATKTGRVAAPPRPVFFPKLESDPDLCPASWLDAYLQRTQGWRKAADGGATSANPLFRVSRTPHGGATSATLARWSKEMLQQAGIDVTVFGAHSMRGAATSAAHARGVSLSDIMIAADWRSAGTFQQFYNRPTESSTFAQSVLSS